MPRIVCRTCGTIRDLPHFGLYSPVHIFPGIIFVYCPKCGKYRLHRKAEPSEVLVEEGNRSTGGRPTEDRPPS